MFVLKRFDRGGFLGTAAVVPPRGASTINRHVSANTPSRAGLEKTQRNWRPGGSDPEQRLFWLVVIQLVPRSSARKHRGGDDCGQTRSLRGEKMQWSTPTVTETEGSAVICANSELISSLWSVMTLDSLSLTECHYTADGCLGILSERKESGLKVWRGRGGL